MTGPDDPRHGTVNGYDLGCHDDCCRTARTAARRETARLDRLVNAVLAAPNTSKEPTP